MIDNVVMLISGALKGREISELLPRCHPLGAFDETAAVGIARTPSELYSAVLVDTPLGDHFSIPLHDSPFPHFYENIFHQSHFNPEGKEVRPLIAGSVSETS